MLRLIFVLGLAFIGSQFPNYYYAYFLATGDEARLVEQSGSSPERLATLRAQERALIGAGPTEWPFAFADAFDADRAGAALEIWEPQMPERPEDWAYGGVGLVLGFLISGVLAALFGGGRRTTPVPRPRTNGKSAARAGSPPASQPWAGSANQAKGRPARSGSRIPVSTGNLREASRIAKEALRQARQAVTSGSDPAVDDRQPTPMDRRVPTAVQRATTVGAVIPSRYRPPAITRRFESPYGGPIERVTRLRD